MEKYILFGSGAMGKTALQIIGKENIECFVDNDIKKVNSFLENIIVLLFRDNINKCKEHKVVITVSEQYEQEIVNQLKKEGITNYIIWSEFLKELALSKLSTSTDNITIYQRAINWIKTNTIENKGIIVNTLEKVSYPEVTGYYIPTLIKWGYKDLAISYAEWLCSIQKEDGSWYDACDNAPYVFDSAQILKGLLAVRYIYPVVDSAIKKGCDWLLSNMTEDGRLTTPCKDAWSNERTCSEIIHLYCLEPLLDAAEVFDEEKYKTAVLKCVSYYKKNNYQQIMNFTLLSHFYAYVMEALVDLGEIDMAQEAMQRLEVHMDEKGYVPGYDNTQWVCSTGLFQLAIVWYKLGNVKHGNKAFEYACKLQNTSGGWYGSYAVDVTEKEKNDYFPVAEISWAVKYFLDALYYKNKVEFEEIAGGFLDSIDETDGRLKVIADVIKEEDKTLKVLDVGCGKGRYIKNLAKAFPNNNYYAVDISSSVMKYFDVERCEKATGSLTDIPYENDLFDIIYTCEALEHAVDIASAVREMVRCTKPGGKIIIVDKNKKALGRIAIGTWEQWFDSEELKSILLQYCTDVKVIENLSYEEKTGDELFAAWIGVKKHG